MYPLDWTVRSLLASRPHIRRRIPSVVQGAAPKRGIATVPARRPQRFSIPCIRSLCKYASDLTDNNLTRGCTVNSHVLPSTDHPLPVRLPGMFKDTDPGNRQQSADGSGVEQLRRGNWRRHRLFRGFSSRRPAVPEEEWPVCFVRFLDQDHMYRFRGSRPSRPTWSHDLGMEVDHRTEAGQHHRRRCRAAHGRPSRVHGPGLRQACGLPSKGSRGCHESMRFDQRQHTE